MLSDKKTAVVFLLLPGMIVQSPFGGGVSGTVEARSVAAGSPALLEAIGVDMPDWAKEQ